MRRSIYISVFAAIVAVMPLVASADVIAPSGHGASADASKVVAPRNAVDALQAALARQQAKLHSDFEVATRNLKAALAAADPKSRTAMIAQRLLKRLEEQNDQLTIRRKQLEEQIDEGNWHYKHEWRIVPL